MLCVNRCFVCYIYAVLSLGNNIDKIATNTKGTTEKAERLKDNNDIKQQYFKVP